MKHKQCQECGKHTVDLYNDPRQPKYIVNLRLCYDCLDKAKLERIQILEKEIAELKEES